MKCFLLAFAFPLVAQINPLGTSETDEPDLFKRNDQIYAGSVEFLYWTVAEGALDYALKPSSYFGHLKRAIYDIDPGFRLGLLYFRAPHYWEIRWQYTRMTNRGENNIHRPIAETFPATSNSFTKAQSRIHLNYNVFDWFVDRVFFPNPHLRLRVIGGLSFAWMSQNWKVLYQDGASTFTKVSNRWNFTGAGIKTGTMFDWYWTGDLYMTAQGFFGILLGSYSNRAEERTNVTTPITSPIHNTHHKDPRATMTTQMSLGPSYQKNFPSNRLEIFAGLEANVWFNVQEVYQSTNSTLINTGMLALYGLTTRMSLDF